MRDPIGRKQYYSDLSLLRFGALALGLASLLSAVPFAFAITFWRDDAPVAVTSIAAGIGALMLGSTLYGLWVVWREIASAREPAVELLETEIAFRDGNALRRVALQDITHATLWTDGDEASAHLSIRQERIGSYPFSKSGEVVVHQGYVREDVCQDICDAVSAWQQSHVVPRTIPGRLPRLPSLRDRNSKSVTDPTV